jgi:hypothetical protein
MAVMMFPPRVAVCRVFPDGLVQRLAKFNARMPDEIKQRYDAAHRWPARGAALCLCRVFLTLQRVTSGQKIANSKGAGFSEAFDTESAGNARHCVTNG